MQNIHARNIAATALIEAAVAVQRGEHFDGAALGSMLMKTGWRFIETPRGDGTIFQIWLPSL